MIQMIGIMVLVIFYFGYFSKLLAQKKRGITTNQMGKGNKSNRTLLIEKLLSLSSTTIIIVIFISAILNTSIFSNPILRGCGLVLMGIGTGLFIIAMVTMEDNWRAGIPDKDKTIMVTRGIYKISRNPAFLGFDLTYIGASLSFSNVVVLLFAVFAILMMHLQILEEEKFLENTFGDNYLKYKNKVGRYFIFI